MGWSALSKHRWDDSPMWKDLLKVKHIYMAGRKLEIRNGENTLFWQDCWLGGQALCTKFPVLYELYESKQITVAEYLRRNWMFGRVVPYPLLEEPLSSTHLCPAPLFTICPYTYFHNQWWMI